MYHIMSEVDSPDFDCGMEIVKEAMKRGIKVDTEEIYNIIEENVCKIQKAKDALGKYGISNPNSTNQIVDAYSHHVAIEDMDLCYINGKVSTSKEVLDKLIEAEYEFPKILEEYREYKKLSDCANELLKFCDDNDLIHPTVTLSSTNRYYLKDPALMNIPKTILWRVIVPYSTKGKLYSIDIKQQEPWILVNMLHIKKLQDKIEEYDDFYRALYAAATGLECNDEQRKQVKTAWNAMSYGAAKPTVVRYCTKVDGDKLYSYFNSIGEYKAYKCKCFGMSKKNYSSVKTYFGTSVQAAGYGSKLTRALMNAPIQGTGADILNLLIQHFDEKVNEDEFCDCMTFYYARHDEIIVEVDGCSQYGEKITEYLRDIFEHQIDDWKPFKVDIKQVGKDIVDEEVSDLE